MSPKTAVPEAGTVALKTDCPRTRGDSRGQLPGTALHPFIHAELTVPDCGDSPLDRVPEGTCPRPRRSIAGTGARTKDSGTK